MFTICPKCALTLAVTAADLRVGQGYVRCGRCSSVFNALASLRDEVAPEKAPEPRAQAPEPPAQAPEPPAAAEASAPPPPEPAQKPVAAPAVPREAEVPDSALEFDPARSDISKLFVSPVGEAEQIGTGTFETIILQGDGISQTEELVPEGEVDVELRDLVSRLDLEVIGFDPRQRSPAVLPPPAPLPDPPPLPADAPPPEPEPPRAAAPLPEASPPVPPAPLPDRTPLPADAPPLPSPPPATAETFVQSLGVDPGDPGQLERRRRRTRLGAAACGALALLLLSQVVHYFRNDLVAHDWFAAPLTRLYASLGMPIAPNWDLDAYEIRQLGAAASATPGGALVIRASVKNGAARPQPVPVIQLTLQDRYGNRLAARALEPGEYLTGGARRALLASGERIDTEIAVADPGQSAVGFEIDTCLHDPRGALRCAADHRTPR